MNNRQPRKSNIVLIGMPGSGKSTVGVILAKNLGMSFLDTDILIQQEEGRTLQEIVDADGHMVLREIEERVLLGVTCTNHVIATGGSAAYSEPAMLHLGRIGQVIFLQTSLEALTRRIHNYETRGLAKRPDQSLSDLFEERRVLYERYADVRIEGSELDQDQVAETIAGQLLLTKN